jgi:hypothetical protein
MRTRTRRIKQRMSGSLDTHVARNIFVRRSSSYRPAEDPEEGDDEEETVAGDDVEHVLRVAKVAREAGPAGGCEDPGDDLQEVGEREQPEQVGEAGEPTPEGGRRSDDERRGGRARLRYGAPQQQASVVASAGPWSPRQSSRTWTVPARMQAIIGNRY